MPLFAFVPRRPLLWVAIMLGPVGCFNPSPEPSDEAPTEAETDTDEAGSTTTEATDTSEGDPGTGSSGGPDAAQEEACEVYCSLMDDHCESIPQYSGEFACMSVCQQMNLGTSEDVLGNTVGCRTHHAFLAARSPDPHCLHAGPTGDGTCGAPCESFCSLALTTCTGSNAMWQDADACIAECQAWEPEPKYQADVADADTFACRMRHLTLAVEQPELHCGHLSTESPICA